MVEDVQSWLDTPSNNFGWILIGDESTSKTVKEIASSENSTEGERPALTVDYTAAGSLASVFVDFDASYPEDGVEVGAPQEIVRAYGDDFVADGAGGTVSLSFEEAQAVLAGLTRAEFAAFDINGDGALSSAEVEAERVKRASANHGGCFGGSKSLTDVKDFFGDLFLLGLLTVAFVAWRRLGVKP